jgi:outer membrane autotransporter protein
MSLKDPKSDARKRLKTCAVLVVGCTWALNVASAQVDVVANGTPVDLFTDFPPPTYPNFNFLNALNGGQITNSGPPPVIINLTNQQYGAFAQTNGTMTLNGVTVVASDPTYTVNPLLGPRGLAAEGPGAVLNATNFTINLSHTGTNVSENGTGLRAVNGGMLTANDGTVTMTGNWNHGIVASAGTVETNAAIVVNGGATPVSTGAYGAFAIGEQVSQYGPSTIVLGPGSSITNHHGVQGIGLYALNNPQGTSTIESYATVTTDGADRGYGALAQGGGHILLHGGSVTTTGAQSHGLYSFGPGSLIVADTAFGGVRTSGNTAHGARANGGVIELNGTTILTTGAGAHGIFAEQGGRVYPTGATDPAMALGDVTVISNGNVTASGELSHGIFANASTAGNAYVETRSAVLGGWVFNAAGAGAAGIQLNGLNGFGRVVAGSTVGALSDLAISGTTTGVGGTIQIENAGIVTGFVQFSGGDNNSILNDGTFDLRHFADTNGDGGRDTVRVAIADLGSGLNNSNSFINNGILALPAVTGATTLDSTGQYLPLANPNNAMALGGPLQGHLIGVTTFTNSGIIDLQSNPAAGDVLVITGARQAGTAGPGTFISNGGTLRLDTVLNQGGAATRSDTLVVDGTSVGPNGATQMAIRNAGGTGALTVGDGILVVQVLDPNRSATGAFSLAQPISAGAFDYFLFKDGVSPGSQGNWYLRNTLVPGPTPAPGELLPSPVPGATIPLYRPEVAVQSVVPTVARELIRLGLGTFNERQGDQLLLRGDRMGGAWGRVFGQKKREQFAQGARPDFDGNFGGFQAGADLFRLESTSGHRDHIGFYVAQAHVGGNIHGSVDGFDGAAAGRLELDAMSVGGYWTHLGPSNWYIDAVLQGTDLHGLPRSIRNFGTSISGGALAASIEGGYPIPLTSWLVFEPQAQGIWQRLSLDDTRDPISTIAFDRSDVFTGRAGALLQGTFGNFGAIWHPYLKGNVWWGSNGFDTVTFGTAANAIPTGRDGGTAVEGGGGVTAKLTRNVSIYADASYLTAVSEETRNAIKSNVGLRVTW